jgi:NAD(P)-dependent dehydrogenase (short-subunit alcohol dehydrogenase family)
VNIRGAVAIVTGSSSVIGIGAEIAKLLGARGCNVVVNYAGNKAGAEETAALCRKGGAEAITVQGDVSVDADCRRLVKAAIDKWGRLDVLVNNAATTKPVKHNDLDALDAAEFQRIYSVNVIGAFQMMRAAGPHLKASGNAAIVNISSIGAFRAGGSSIAYTASKAALNNLTLALARVLAPEVRVNALCPGGLVGNWTRKILPTEAEYQKRVQEAETKYPLRKPITPEDVARAALWLIEDASTMTGEAIRMDSGQHLL